MRTAGIDIGSRNLKLVIMNEECVILEQFCVPSTFNPVVQAKKILSSVSFDHIIPTGYGRHLFCTEFKAQALSEIVAHGEAASFLYPEASVVLDIGGQDTKVIELDSRGSVKKFEMNDRCASGTGRFLEIMANAFQVDVNDFGNFALNAEKAVPVSNMCTVFAESEVISLISKGEKAENIALGVHMSVLRRILSMIKRFNLKNGIIFSGGVAKNPCIRRILKNEIGTQVSIPEFPQMMGALGAAIHGLKKCCNKIKV